MDILPYSHKGDLWRVEQGQTLTEQLCLDIDTINEGKANDTLSCFQKENQQDMADIEKELSDDSIFNDIAPILTQAESEFLHQALSEYKLLPRTVVLLWEGVIPLLIEFALCVTDPEDTLQANVKLVRRVYAETRKRFGTLPPIFLNINVHDAFAVAMGLIKHPNDEDIVKNIMQGKKIKSLYTTPMGAFARQEALHTLEVVLGRIWLNHYRYRLTTKETIVDLIEILNYLYWKASRSDLFDIMILTGDHSIEDVEKKEREAYFSHFDEDNVLPFIEYLTRNTYVMRVMRLHCQHRHKRFLMKDKRLKMTQAEYFDLLSHKFGKVRIEPEESFSDGDSPDLEE